MMSIRKKFAFTIIEVLVVVAIIGTLSAIGLMSIVAVLIQLELSHLERT